ncbi:hypothetical protein ABT117_33025 [Streptomyces sp. NPDC002262]|uniref:hypothetical protein n=1 Tax=Streptomyces sp. NPDC002262 TaxID=3154414 RepID=UPI00332EB1E6
MTTRQNRARAAVLGGLAFVLALAGCTADTDEKGTTKPAPPTVEPPVLTDTPPATPDPQAADKEAALKAYTAMWTEQMKAYAKADTKGTNLEKYVSLVALGQIRLDLARMKQAGTVATGELGHEPEVTALDTTGPLSKATVQDCLDLSGWKTVRVKTGETIPLPSAQPRRYLATATVEKWPTGWIVTTYTPDGEHTC